MEMRERRGGRYRLEICPENKRDPLILNHVKSETIIIPTDMRKPILA